MNVWNQGEGNGVSVVGTGNANSGTLSGRKSAIQESYLVAVGSRTARLRKKYKDKIIIVVLLIVLFILLIVVIIISVYYSIEKNNKLCLSHECVRSAANILMSMDQSVDPCEDFFEYACGNWAEDHPKPDFSYSHDWFSEKQKKVERRIRDVLAMNATEFDPLPVVQAKEMYAACMNKDAPDKLGMKPVIDFMKSVNLPLFPSMLNLTPEAEKKAANFSFNWLNVIVNIKKKLAYDMIIGFEIYPDFKNSTLKRIVLGQADNSGLSLRYKNVDGILKILKRNRYEQKKKSAEKNDDEEDSKKKAEYMLLFKKMLKAATIAMIKESDEKLYKNVSKEKLDENVDCVVQEYIDFSSPDESKDNTTTNNNTTTDKEYSDEILYYTVDKLQDEINKYLISQNMTAMNIWKNYLNQMFNNTGIKLNFTSDLIMTTDYDIDALISSVEKIQTTSNLSLEMIIWFQILESFIPYTTSELKELYNNYLKKATGIPNFIPHSVHCAGVVNNMMGMAIAYSVAEESYRKTTLPQVKKMLSNIRYSFESTIATITWMDIPTKVATIEKIRNMKDLIGYPEWLFVPGKLEEYYKGVVTDPEKNLENQIKLLELNFGNKLKDFRKLYVFSWETLPTEVNAYHTYQANAITIPLVMTQYPFYGLGLEALNYGYLGTILSHELTHGFDNMGRKFDKDGMYVQWWTNETIDKYENKTKCLVNQYSDFFVPELGEHVDGNNTLGENIADNGGLRTALRAYRMENEKNKYLPGLPKLSKEQLFFLAYGNLWCSIRTEKSLAYDIKDEHSPMFLRIKGTLQNMPEFAKAWNCRKNTTMNPDKRCIIF